MLFSAIEMTLLPFDKYEGLGNDFVVVDAAGEEEMGELDARAWCDRRRGIGGDGVLVMLPAREGEADARMRVLNADGSIAEMCGNGLRCAALHLARKRGLDEGTIAIETDAGVRACVIERRGDEAVVVADMGIVRTQGDVVVALDGKSVALTRVDAGNPHAVAFCEVTRAEFEALGPRLSAAGEFPGGVNVEFVRVVDGVLDVLVWERGAGPTLACGTGACAVVAAAFAKNVIDGEAARVRLPGGQLLVQHDRATGKTTMRGPARWVFSGAVARP
jgi:diaminopimelate epimerase